MEFLRYMDVSEELSNRICANLNNFFNYKQFCELLKTGEVTQTRINRALLHIMLGIKKKKNVKGTALYAADIYMPVFWGVSQRQRKALSLISEHSNCLFLFVQLMQQKPSQKLPKMLTRIYWHRTFILLL